MGASASASASMWNIFIPYLSIQANMQNTFNLSLDLGHFSIDKIGAAVILLLILMVFYPFEFFRAFVFLALIVWLLGLHLEARRLVHVRGLDAVEAYKKVFIPDNIFDAAGIGSGGGRPQGGGVDRGEGGKGEGSGGQDKTIRKQNACIHQHISVALEYNNDHKNWATKDSGNGVSTHEVKVPEGRELVGLVAHRQRGYGIIDVELKDRQNDSYRATKDDDGHNAYWAPLSTEHQGMIVYRQRGYGVVDFQWIGGNRTTNDQDGNLEYRKEIPPGTEIIGFEVKRQRGHGIIDMRMLVREYRR